MTPVAMGTEVQTCKACGAEMKKRNGKFGQFWGCSTFPRCRHTVNIRKGGQAARPAKPDPRPKLDWSKFQTAIFDLAKNLDTWTHLVIRAGAGSGKTTVGVEFANLLPGNLSIAFVAFNAKIARTFGRKLPSHVHASTLHSLAFGNVRNTLGQNVQVEGKKVFYIIKGMTDRMDWERAEVIDQSIASIKRLVSLCKATLVEPTDANLGYIADRWNVETNGDRSIIFETAREAYRKSVNDTQTIDFDDMIHLCATGRVPCKQFDVLVIDETQDLNKANLEFVCKSIKPGGHIVAVGDENQSIYGFRGADTDAMPNIIKRLDAKVLPLSITYRVPLSGVELANTLVPELEAAPGAEDGILEGITSYQFRDMVGSGDLVLCRTNAPLVGPCFDLIRQGTKAVILGRDIGQNLMAMVKKIQKRHRVRSLNDTLEHLMTYRRIEFAKLVQIGKEMQAQTLDDKVETIIALSDGCTTVADLQRKVEKVFSDDEAGVTFSTVHKSKGGEADRVFLLRPELMPHPKATAGWEMDQEYNIQYVAYTRHKKALYFVDGEPPFTTAPDDDDTEAVAQMEGDALERAEAARHAGIDEISRQEAEIDERLIAAEDHRMQQIIDQEARESEWLAKQPLDGKDGPTIETAPEGYGDPQAPSNILDQFPTPGRFESNIYRPSAQELSAAMPDFTPGIEQGQLILTRNLTAKSQVKVWTSIKVGQIAGGTGDDSIRVVREDLGKNDKIWRFKNKQDWVTRQVPQDYNTPKLACDHLAAKIQVQIDTFSRPCPECEAIQVKCRAGHGKNVRFWWKASCQHKVVDGGW